jgi:hypothetical protein
LLLQIGTSWWLTYRVVAGLGAGQVHGVVHHRWVNNVPGFSFGAVVVEYPLGRWGFHWHVNPRLEYGWVRGRPDGWQGRVFVMGMHRWRRGALLMESRARYEWFRDWDGHQSPHQRLRPAVFLDYRLSEKWRLQGMIEPMYWVQHRRYAAWSLNQWRFLSGAAPADPFPANDRSPDSYKEAHLQKYFATRSNSAFSRSPALRN